VEHLAFFSLTSDPFRNDPELDLFFKGAAQREATRRLLRCINQNKELVLLTGPTGVGKTLLLRSVFEELDPDHFEVALLVVSRGVEPEWLRMGIAAQLGVEDPAAERAVGMRELYERLAELREADRRAVILIDEAQALTEASLAELRSLMNLELEERKLLSFVLVGPADLEAFVAREPGILDRVEVRVYLEALSDGDAVDYLQHRLQAAGAEGRVFAPEALGAIAERASGIPRRLNALADNALFEAYLAGRSPATLDDVEQAARELPWAKGSAPEVDSEENSHQEEADLRFEFGKGEPEPEAKANGESTAAGLDSSSTGDSENGSATGGSFDPWAPQLDVDPSTPLTDDQLDEFEIEFDDFEVSSDESGDRSEFPAAGDPSADSVRIEEALRDIVDGEVAVTVDPAETEPPRVQSAARSGADEASEDDELEGLFVDLVSDD